jgi:hypothetical protein
MSIVDMSSSFWLGLSTWPIPNDTDVLWAVGNVQTCTAQGFFTQSGIASPLYNASLSIYCLLVVRYSWGEEKIKRLEPYLHLCPILFGLGTALASVGLEILNNANLWCFIAADPNRGTNADLYRWLFFYAPLWLIIVLITVNLVLVFLYVRRVTMKSERFVFSASAHNLVSDEEISSHFGLHPAPTTTTAATAGMDTDTSTNNSTVVAWFRQSLVGMTTTSNSNSNSSTSPAVVIDRRNPFARQRTHVANQSCR